jgi:hypothetical protein
MMLNAMRSVRRLVYLHTITVFTHSGVEYRYDIVPASTNSRSSGHNTLLVGIRSAEDVYSSAKRRELSSALEASRLAMSQMNTRMHDPRGMSAATSVVDSSQSAFDATTSQTASTAADAIAPLNTALLYVGKIVQIGDQIAQVGPCLRLHTLVS